MSNELITIERLQSIDEYNIYCLTFMFTKAQNLQNFKYKLIRKGMPITSFFKPSDTKIVVPLILNN